jgi:hypothetical protein
MYYNIIFYSLRLFISTVVCIDFCQQLILYMESCYIICDLQLVRFQTNKKTGTDVSYIYCTQSYYGRTEKAKNQMTKKLCLASYY